MDSLGYDALPRGRHHLTREQVAASQRERLLQAIMDAVAEKGYVRTSVADVLKRAHVSRETFYEHFADKQACFLAAFEEGAELLLTVVGEAMKVPGASPLERFERAVAAGIDLLVRDPAHARTFLLEIYAAGPAGAARRFEIQRRFVRLANALLLEDERWRALPDPEFACGMLLGGIAGLVTGKVAAHDLRALPALRDPILTYTRTLLR